MTPFRQLLRQPVRLIAILLLLGISATFFCLSGGVFASAQTTLNEVERNYVTIAAPTTELIDYTESPITEEMWQYMDTLAADKSLMQRNVLSKIHQRIQSIHSHRNQRTRKLSLRSSFGCSS